jgi:hypothetical protein
MRTTRILLACAIMLALCSAAFAAEFWVIKEKGRCIIVQKKPADVSIIFKGPFSVRKEAEVIVKECAPAAGVTVQYWVVREPSGALIIVDKRPSDASVIVKGPFRERKQAEVVIKESPRSGTAPSERRPAKQPKAGQERSPAVQPKAGAERAPVEQPKVAPERKPAVQQKETPERSPAVQPKETPQRPAEQPKAGPGEREHEPK